MTPPAPEPGQPQDPAPPCRSSSLALRRRCSAGRRGCRACRRARSRARREAAPARRSSCRRRAGRSSTGPASSSRSASRRRPSTPIRGRCATPRVVATAAARTLGVDADALYEQLREQASAASSTSNAQGRSRRRPRCSRSGSLAGLGFYPEERRFYPQGSVASHVLGYAGLDNRGLAGLELQLDKTLAGKPGSETRIDRRARARARRRARAARQSTGATSA